MKKILLLTAGTILFSVSTFAGLCETNCAASQVRCAKFAKSDRDHGMCRWAYNSCMRSCASGRSNLKMSLTDAEIDSLQESLEELRALDNTPTAF